MYLSVECEAGNLTTTFGTVVASCHLQSRQLCLDFALNNVPVPI